MVVLSASTLGAPGEDLAHVLTSLRQTGIGGVELRLSTGEIADPAMTRRRRREIRRAIADAGVTITGVASYVRVAADLPDDLVLGALIAALDVAGDLGAPVVRVFPGAPTHPSTQDRVPELVESREKVADRAARRLDSVAAYAAECGVVPALETHDSHPTGALIAEVLGRVESPVGAIWDLVHPWRVGESLTDTWAALGPWVIDGRGSVQVKDAALPESATPLPIGLGHLPTDPFGELLVAVGYTGTVTLEWERAWHPEAAPLEDACRSFRRWSDRQWPGREGIR
ncbi:sugar phosphate isomerase/epimerase family protein [uncultured Microbacterium sp.]|uniref:sugar phosphate isomerase/epimerase family protein n=1 Tax=uncultured Microbacterium sp. TaxID=191216 RepID=UPI0035CA37E2